MTDYLDDCDAGDYVISNRIVNVKHGVLIGCGQDNHVIGNTFEKCRCGVSVDDRGLTWMKWLKKIMIQKLEKLPYRSETWMKKYPNLKSYESHDPCEPIHIDIIANKFRKCHTEIGLAEKVRLYMDFINIKK